LPKSLIANKSDRPIASIRDKEISTLSDNDIFKKKNYLAT
ncbi:7481_t:CDS:1, partial [Funneliformis caledonium]